MKAAKKRRAIHESDASLLFFAQGEANAEADVAAYQHELTEAARPGALRRWWMLAAAAALAVIATIVYVASS